MSLHFNLPVMYCFACSLIVDFSLLFCLIGGKMFLTIIFSFNLDCYFFATTIWYAAVYELKIWPLLFRITSSNGTSPPTSGFISQIRIKDGHNNCDFLFVYFPERMSKGIVEILCFILKSDGGRCISLIWACIRIGLMLTSRRYILSAIETKLLTDGRSLVLTIMSTPFWCCLWYFQKKLLGAR